MMKNTLYIFLIVVCNLAFGHKQIVQISVPKCGTHLLAKCIRLLTGRKHVVEKKGIHFHPSYYAVPSVNMVKALTNLPPTEFWVTHMFHNDYYAKYLSNKDFINFFIYRDPRDMVVSFAFFMLNRPSLWPTAAEMTFDELLFDIIAQGSMFKIAPTKGKNIGQLYKQYMSWLKDPNVLSIRFEDLIGTQGGNSAQEQYHAISKIAEHLEIQLSANEITTIVSNLFGGTNTFREGKIGEWKKYFKEQHITAFKKVAGNVLIELGYEKDLNW